ncbi:hypothetical protein BKI52_11890 [marine bacterium AO1-C]|nr:hypothetical protein BKI52_11890 [marine bacterium AO1-C]
MISYWLLFFVIAAGQGIFLAILLFLRPPQINRWLGVLIALFSLTIAHYVTFWANLFGTYPHLMGLSATLPWLFGPTLYLYVKQIQNPQTLKFTKHTALHFLPFTLDFAFYLPFFFSTASYKIMRAQQPHQYEWHTFFSSWGQVIALLIYAILIYRLVSAKKQTSQSLRTISLLFLGFALSFASYYIMTYGFQYVKIYDYYISVLMVITIYWVGYIGFMKPETLQPAVSEPTAPSKYRNSGLEKHHAEHLLTKLQTLMQQEQLYLNPELKMKVVADKMGISSHHLSQILNEQAGQNYADFINSYRISAARQRLSNPNAANEKIITIAYDVGFNTKASFNAHFKKQTGMSPSAYKKQCLGNQVSDMS